MSQNLIKNLRVINKQLEKRIQEKIENEERLKIEIESLKRQVAFFKDIEKTLRKANDMNKNKLNVFSTVELNKTTKADISSKYSKKRNASDHNVKDKVHESSIIMSSKIVRTSLSPFIKKINPIAGTLSVSKN